MGEFSFEIRYFYSKYNAIVDYQLRSVGTDHIDEKQEQEYSINNYFHDHTSKKYLAAENTMTTIEGLTLEQDLDETRFFSKNGDWP